MSNQGPELSPEAYRDVDLSQSAQDEEEKHALLSHKAYINKVRERRMPWLLLCATSWIITFLTISLYVWDKNSNTQESYESGWKTDFVTSRNAIQIEKKDFTGAPTITEDGDVVVLNKDPIRFVGEPSPEVDDAWETLAGGRYFLITEKEAKQSWGDEYREYWSDERGGYVAGLDVFHTLHCLNQIRQKLHPEYYHAHSHVHSHSNSETQMIHNGHCIEQIRQYIMCAGDLTVLGTKYYSGLGRNYVLSDVTHTCRNFDAIRDWTWERYNGSTAVKPVYKISR